MATTKKQQGNTKANVKTKTATHTTESKNCGSRQSKANSEKK